MKMKKDELESVPGIGKTIAQDLREIGINKTSDLKGRNPEKLYAKMCEHQGKEIDRCMLYVLRCAVYFASNDRYDPKKLQWWNWKDVETPKD